MNLTSLVTSINPDSGTNRICYKRSNISSRLNQYKRLSQDQIKELTLSVYDGKTTLDL